MNIHCIDQYANSFRKSSTDTAALIECRFIIKVLSNEIMRIDNVPVGASQSLAMHSERLVGVKERASERAKVV